jgi:tyrosyl-tRNA synthetase
MDPLNRILRGTTQVVSPDELKMKLSEKRSLIIKLGVDPTAPDIHLGHTVVLNKLRLFQELGHKVVFIIGDFTASIGDPSGRDATRPALDEKEIEKNIKTYQDQLFKVLDKSKTTIRRNSEWLKPLFDPKNPDFLPKKIFRQHTVQQLMERDDFTERRKAGEPISVLELLYPLFQGYDSVAIKADVELGGNDQLFNLLMGRQMQKDAGQKSQVVLTMPLLEGLDGARKMSKSYGNHVGVNDNHNDMFSKLMSISDTLMWSYYELLTEEDVSVKKKLHPMEAKKQLAGLITERFHGASKAKSAREEFESVFSKGGTPQDIDDFQLPHDEMDVVELLVKSKLADSKNEARRLVEQGGVKLNERKLDLGEKISPKCPQVLKVGKRKFKNLIPYYSKD